MAEVMINIGLLAYRPMYAPITAVDLRMSIEETAEQQGGHEYVSIPFCLFCILHRCQ